MNTASIRSREFGSRARGSGRRSRSYVVLSIVSFLLLSAIPVLKACAESPGTRPPARAGSFYPEEPENLRRAVQFYLDDARPGVVEEPVALIVPHAGYVFSGQIAADAFSQVRGGDYETVVILGTNHTTPGFRGASVWHEGAYRTPLGLARVDSDLGRELLDADRRFRFRREVHLQEHSVEVEIPFIQTVLPGAMILPVIVGIPDIDLCRDLGKAIAERARGKKVLLVASSDLSHYPSHDDAVHADHNVIRAIATLEPDEVQKAIRKEMNRGAPGLSTCACGEAPILTALVAAREMGAAHAVAVSYANSGDTPYGETGRVVGYGAIVLAAGEGASDLSALEPPKPAEPVSLTEEQRAFLLALARRTVEQHLVSGTVPFPRSDDPALYAGRGAFVTLKSHGRLRGCIGHMLDDRPLCEVVGAMAVQAAFRDRRFSPLTASELNDITIEVSVLTPFQEVGGPEEIVVGRDGVVLRKQGRSAVYLPQVATEQRWDREEMLTHLSAKAGLDGDAWRSGASFFTFQAEVFGEREH